MSKAHNLSENDLAQIVHQLRIHRVTPHGDNLHHQVKVTSIKRIEVIDILAKLVPAYAKLVDAVEQFDFSNIDGCVPALVQALDEYFMIARQPENDKFLSQSDFKTSIIPEFLLRIAHRYINQKELPYVATGQADIPIEIAFDLKRPQLVVPRLQRVDFAVVKPVNLQVDGRVLANFNIPLIGAEVKTYFDKNMITGVAYSVGALKNTFPHCVYVAIGEFADFELADDSFASTEIDEIYILRRQKRSMFRRTGTARSTCPELIADLIKLIISTIASHSKVHQDLKLRIPRGRLVLGNPEL